MDILHLDLDEFENFEPNIVNIINLYKQSIENYEKNFFLELPEYIDDRYLNLFFECDLTLLFKEEISLNEKIKILNNNSLEIYDIKNTIAMTVKYENKTFSYKWNMFKSENFESTLDSNPIRHFKNYLLTSEKFISNKKDILEFTLDEVISITSFKLCLHCVTKDYIMLSTEKNNFIELLKEKLV